MTEKKLAMLITILCMLSISKGEELQQTNKDNNNYNQFLQSTPKIFGLIIDARPIPDSSINSKSEQSADQTPRKQDELIKKMRQTIVYYATMDCVQMTQINIIYNFNHRHQQQVFMADEQYWVRPVYFLRSTRLQATKQTAATIYFIINSNHHLLQCEELTESFMTWKSKSVGDIAPLMGYNVAGYDFILRQQIMVYAEQNQLQNRGKAVSILGIHSIISMNAAWLPRIFLQILQLNNNYETFKISQILANKPVCQDIAINFITAYFFPELISVRLFGIASENPQKNRYADVQYKTQIKNKSECIKQFSQVLGYNPLRLILRQQQQQKSISKFSSQTLIFSLYLRRLELTQRYRQLSHLNNHQIEHDLPTNIQQKVNQDINDKLTSIEQLDVTSMRVKAQQLSSLSRQSLKKQLQIINFQSSKIEQNKNQILQKVESSKKNTESRQKGSKNGAESLGITANVQKQVKQKLYSYMSTIMDMSLVLIVVIILMLLYLFISCSQVNSKYEQLQAKHKHKIKANSRNGRDKKSIHFGNRKQMKNQYNRVSYIQEGGQHYDEQIDQIQIRPPSRQRQRVNQN